MTTKTQPPRARKRKRGRKPLPPGVIRNFRELAAPPHQRWRAAIADTEMVAMKDIWPGCVGLAMAFSLDHMHPWGDRSWLPNSMLDWTVMFSVPPGHFAGYERREVRWTASMQACLRYGAPQVNANDAFLTYDFRRIPFGKRVERGGIVEAGDWREPTTLNSETHPRAFEISTRIVETMNAYGWRHRRSWGGKDGSKYRYGIGTHDKLPPPRSWMPVPYLAVPWEYPTEALRTEFEDGIYSLPLRSAFVAGAVDGLRVYAPCDGTYVGPQTLVDSDTDDAWTREHVMSHQFDCNGEMVEIWLHKDVRLHRHVGEPVRFMEEIGFAAPEMERWWRRLGPLEKWFRLGKAGMGRRRVEFEMEWFVQRSSINVDGKVCMPFDLVSRFATTHPDQVELVGWLFPNLEALNDLYDPEIEAAICPPIPLRKWNQVHHHLPGGVQLVAAGDDPRLQLRGAGKKKRRRHR